jgi:ectoine hydroxylase-related dioxygenase (phytanoyl-CoA dioxygenase family)
VTVRAVIPAAVRAALLRRLNLEITRVGLTPEEIARCSLGTFFPHLRWEPEVVAVRDALEELLQPAPGSEWADAQLLLRFPDEAEDWPLEPHVDQEPDWAGERRYVVVAGVALSQAHEIDGALSVWPGSHLGQDEGARLVELDPGDVILMHPELRHCSTLNRGATIRYATYFRLLGPDPVR